MYARDQRSVSHRPYQPKPSVPEGTLATGAIALERKVFTFWLKENPLGRFLRITEEAGGRRNSIMVPADGVADFAKALAEVMGSSSKTI